LEKYKLSEDYLNFIIENSKSWWDCYDFMYDELNAFKNISRYQNLSEEFINQYKDKLEWKNITIYQNLSEKFIEKYSKKIIWNFIPIRQTVSYKFIKKNINRFNWINISKILFKVSNLNDYKIKLINIKKFVKWEIFVKKKTKISNEFYILFHNELQDINNNDITKLLFNKINVVNDLKHIILNYLF
jgi:hypothetical protein